MYILPTVRPDNAEVKTALGAPARAYSGKRPQPRSTKGGRMDARFESDSRGHTLSVENGVAVFDPVTLRMAIDTLAGNDVQTIARPELDLPVPAVLGAMAEIEFGKTPERAALGFGPDRHRETEMGSIRRGRRIHDLHRLLRKRTTGRRSRFPAGRTARLAGGHPSTDEGSGR